MVIAGFIVAIIGVILLVIAVIFFERKPDNSMGMYVIGLVLSFIGICLESTSDISDKYATKVIKHQYSIEYTLKVNNNNQVVERDTTLIWK